jgi:soluble lytic murein transglycosylase-like protein
MSAGRRVDRFATGFVVLAALAMFVGCGSAPPRPASPKAGCGQYVGLAEQAAERHGIDWALVAAVATVESKWHPGATSRVGARGLMQVMPRTGQRLKCGDLYDPEENLECGARLLGRLMRRYDGQVVYALSAYAAGPRDPDLAFKRKVAPPRQRFIKRVMALSRQFRESGCAAAGR